MQWIFFIYFLHNLLFGNVKLRVRILFSWEDGNMEIMRILHYEVIRYIMVSNQTHRQMRFCGKISLDGSGTVNMSVARVRCAIWCYLVLSGAIDYLEMN